MTILYIILFIVCLSTLIMVHEAGHLMTAKIFKVYCFEYAIGFGPRLLSFKRKNGETRFSLRAIPFGGFVSMYGESELVPEDVGPIDPSRSLNNIKKWKKSIIMTAGIAMNFVLALVIFFIYEIAFPGHIARVAHVSVSKNSLAYNAGLRSKDYVYTPTLVDDYYIFYDDGAVLTYPDESTTEVFFGYNYASITLKNQSLYSNSIAFKKQSLGHIDVSYTDISIADALAGDYSSSEVVINRVTGFLRAAASKKINKSTYLVKVAITENYLDEADKALYAEITLPKDKINDFKRVPVGTTISLAGDISYKNKRNELTVSGLDSFETHYADTSTGNYLTTKNNKQLPSKISFNFYVLNEETNIGRGEAKPLNNITLTKGKLPKNIGVSMQLDTYHNSYQTAVKNTFEDFGTSATLIYRGLGSLFTKDGWNNVGGIVAIGVSSTQILQEYGFGTFLYFWALISVNLGIVNLLPFPGLDGWHFLVTIIEGVTHKEIPSKFKNAMQAIGLLLLFSLMILIVIKDIIGVI